eukprot:4411140-Lingulodinium_polyedra.AAC.1
MQSLANGLASLFAAGSLISSSSNGVGPKDLAELGKGDDLATPGLEKKAVVVETAMAERSSSVAWAGWLSSFSDLVVGGK